MVELNIVSANEVPRRRGGRQSAWADTVQAFVEQVEPGQAIVQVAENTRDVSRIRGGFASAVKAMGLEEEIAYSTRSTDNGDGTLNVYIIREPLEAESDDE